MAFGYEEKMYRVNGAALRVLEAGRGDTPLILLHAQSVCARSYQGLFRALGRKYRVYSIDCFGHGGSEHEPALYNVRDIGSAVTAFAEREIGRRARLLGHSSGGLIAAYAASHSDIFERLYLEDPPLFSCQGERRVRAFNYADLSTICDQYLREGAPGDFPAYYFRRQKAWDFFPEASREKLRDKLSGIADRRRARFPKRDLWVPFWPAYALAGFVGMQDYDPRFGLAFFNDTFHAGIPHEEMLRAIRCKTLLMKAKTNVSADGLLMCAMSEEDASRAAEAIPDCRVERFDCGHGLHLERRAQFLDCLLRDGV